MRKILVLAALLWLWAIPVKAQFSRINTVTLRNSNDTQAAIYASPYTIKLGAGCTWSISGTVATLSCAAGGGTVTSVSSGNLSPLFTVSVATATTTPAFSFALSNAAGGTVFGRSAGTTGAPAYTSTPVLGIPTSTLGTLGFAGSTSGTATITPQVAAGTPTLTLPNASGTFAVSASAPLSLSATTGALTCSTCTTGGITGSGTATFVPQFTSASAVGNSIIHDDGTYIFFGTSGAIARQPIFYASNFYYEEPNGTIMFSAHDTGEFDVPNGPVKPLSYQTQSNCADSAGAAACGSAAAGAVVVDAAATTVVVSTTAVTANSEIFVQYDSSLGTRLGITCNTTAALPAITARTAGVSFTVTVPVAPAVNPACYDYHIVN